MKFHMIKWEVLFYDLPALSDFKRPQALLFQALVQGYCFIVFN